MSHNGESNSEMDASHRALLLLSWACMVLASTDSVEFCCGRIFPESPVLEVGKEFTATCVLSEKGKKETGATADDIYWDFKNVPVPKEYYTKLNDSAASMTVNVTSDLESPLKCNVITRLASLHSSPRIVHGVFFSVGYPPEKPRNLTCMVVLSVHNPSRSPMTCWWDPGTRDPILDTSYTLIVREPTKNHSFAAERDRGQVHFETLPVYVSVDIWVQAENKLGKERSDVYTVDPVDIIKPNPPLKVHVTSEQGFPTSLLVRWNQSVESVYPSLKYNIRFCAAGSDMWSEIPPNDTLGPIESFRVQYLEPYTEYVFQVRCMSQNGYGYWSEWSQNATAKTPEAKPSSKPDLWRYITSSEDCAETSVELMWKAPVHSNGRIVGYNITVQEDGKVKSFQASEGDQMYKTSVKRPVLITLTAHNSVGASPAAYLIIPKTNRDPLPVKNVTCLPRDGTLWVEWEPPRPNLTEYVLEWVSVSDGAMDWQREPGSARQASLKGDFQPFKRYNVSVYPVHQGKPGKPVTVQAYLQQGPPSVGPSVREKSTGKTHMEFQWDELTLDQMNGFITNYTVFYKTGDTEKFITLPANATSCKLRSLSAESKYVVWVMASTAGGSTIGPGFTFNTLKYASGEIEAIVVLVCIGFLFFTVLTVLVCINKKEMIKKHVWPQVPDPSNSTIANWSPDFPSRPEAPKEGSLTDVSVVEVDVFDKKSLGEEDKASLPLKKDKYLSEEHSSGIGGSSCMSSPRQSVSDSDEGDSGQTTASTVQYSSVVASGYKGQTPSQVPPSFARSESTQPLLDSEEHHDDPQGQDSGEQPHTQRYPRTGHFRRPRTVDESSPLKLHQIEMAEHSSGPLGFCSVEEGSQQTTPTAEAGIDDENVGPAPSYMPQRSGYRPQ
ncbi:interleukin-6 receptor subunit beta-like isoform X1 [Megalops cyprinoides]|uniref:interleukin-6 receptor subunit beta-like isoform X1 n=2 Tax=Megalops cyprinoides TaxID=118141 RepID=UPI0018654CE6|nr:interleukin-6 receptor subunit beta-like isoform X1 [Megalops cyprinoides]